MVKIVLARGNCKHVSSHYVGVGPCRCRRRWAIKKS
jgi:hypothetical protein